MIGNPADGWLGLGLDVAIVIAAIAAMEGVAAFTHRHIMHGRWGWGLHRDHHEAHDGHLERNDIYALIASAAVAALFVAGNWIWPLTQIAIGASLYGLLYFVVHDGLVHQRWPFRHVPRRGYLRRLYQAHLLHHATDGREGGVSFGFLYAPPVRRLKDELARQKADSRDMPPAARTDPRSEAEAPSISGP